jgi:hypothetical protein
VALLSACLIGCGSPSVLNTALNPTPTPLVFLQPTATRPLGNLPPTPTPVPWDTQPFFEASPDCVPDAAHWAFYKGSPNGMLTCPGSGTRLTFFSSISFTGVTSKLPPNMTVSVRVSQLTATAVASLGFELVGGSDGKAHSYSIDFDSTLHWNVNKDDQTGLRHGTYPPITSVGVTLTVISSGATRTFQINGANVATINDGVTFSKPSSCQFGLGGNDGVSGLFSAFSFTP